MAQARFFVSRLEAERGSGELPPARPDEAAAAQDLQLDPLTGLGNRRCMESRMPALMRAKWASSSTFSQRTSRPWASNASR